MSLTRLFPSSDSNKVTDDESHCGWCHPRGHHHHQLAQSCSLILTDLLLLLHPSVSEEKKKKMKRRCPPEVGTNYVSYFLMDIDK